MVKPLRKQVLVVGAGAAGMLAADALSRAGLECLVVERKAWTRWGDKWCVEVDAQSVADGTLPAPAKDVVLHRGEGGAELYSPSLQIALSVSPFPVYSLRLWKYQRQILKGLEAAGSSATFDTSLLSFEREASGRVMARIRTGRKESRVLCDLLVLATGNAFEMDRLLYAHFALRRQVFESDFVLARQELWEADLEKGGGLPVSPDTAGYFMGVAGPCSTLSVWLSKDRRRVSLLAGGTPVEGAENPRELLEAFRRDHPVFVQPESGGGATIPMRRPVDLLAGPGLALIGNCACQVNPLTGSGLTLTGRAAQLLADAATEYCLSGRRFESLWKYNLAYQQKFGAFQAGGQAMMSWMRGTGPSADSVERLMASGAVDGEDMRRNLRCESALPGAAAAARKFGTLAFKGRELKEVAGLSLRMAAAENFYRHLYPRDSDLHAVRRFGLRAEKLVGV